MPFLPMEWDVSRLLTTVQYASQLFTGPDVSGVFCGESVNSKIMT